MLRIWALVLAFIASMVTIGLLGPLGGSETLLTAGVPVGAGIAVAVWSGGGYIARGIWFFVGILIGALGFAVSAATMPDTVVGAVIGGSIPVVINALFTMWTRRQAYFIAAMLGGGAIAGTYAYRFNVDPQALNFLLPIVIGQTVLPAGLGFFYGSLAGLTKNDDEFFKERDKAKEEKAAAKASETETDTATADVEA